MKIAIDVSPISDQNSQHSVRGSGFYIRNLTKALAMGVSKHEYVFLSKIDEIPADADIFHVPYFDPFFMTLRLFEAIPTVVTVHDLTPIKFPTRFPKGIKGTFKWFLQKRNLQKVKAVITDSLSSQQDIHEFVGLNKNAISVIPLAADEIFRKLELKPATVLSTQKKYNLPNQFVLYVGDVTWNKNLPRIIQAVKAARVPLVLVGKALSSTSFDRKSSWNRDLVEVQSMVKNDSMIHTLGFVSSDDLVILYNLATAFLMPSLYEGFGLPVLEALSCGCPVIASKEGSLPEVGGDAVYYTDAYDVKNISSAVYEVFNNESLQQNLTRKGLQHVKKFSWQKAAEETVSVYESIAKR